MFSNDKENFKVCFKALQEVTEENEQLKLKLERVTRKLDTDTNAIAKQLVYMTNNATSLKIQIEKANKILEEYTKDTDFMVETMRARSWIKRLSEALASLENHLTENQK
jgi:hypothetical protein